MERDAIRLECLRLVTRVDETPDVAIVKAKVLENYVLGTDVAKPIVESKKNLIRSKSDNAEILS